MIKLVLIGTGNVAIHLLKAFAKSEEVEVLQVVGRNTNVLKSFENDSETGFIDQVRKDADIYIIAVSDDAIGSVNQELNDIHSLVVHTSGAVSMGALESRERRGVFYPLQTFSPERQLSLKEVPICLESEQPSDLNLLHTLAYCVSDRVLHVPSEKRLQLHLAAVFANNFTNHLCHLAHDILGEADLPFDLLFPLIQETASKLKDHAPYLAQTGPARRRDLSTIARQIKLLKTPTQKQIYQLLSNSIQETYAKKL